MATVFVSTEAMKQSAALFEQAVNDCIQILNGVNVEIGALQASWKGVASQTFAQVTKDWGDQFQVVIKELDAMKDNLMGNQSNYSQNEYQQVTISKQLDALLGGDDVA